MRRRRRVFALLFIFSAFITPLGFFYFTIARESSRFGYSESSEQYGGFQTSEATEAPEAITVDFKRFSEYECLKFPVNVSRDWPECLNKMKWIKNGWKFPEPTPVMLRISSMVQTALFDIICHKWRVFVH